MSALNYAIDAARVGSINIYKAEDITDMAKVFEEFLKVDVDGTN